MPKARTTREPRRRFGSVINRCPVLRDLGGNGGQIAELDHATVCMDALDAGPKRKSGASQTTGSCSTLTL